MRSISIAAVLLALAAPVVGQELVDGSSTAEIETIAKGYGSATLEEQPGGDPRIAGSINGIPYYVFFMNCADATPCEDLNFYAAFGGVKPPLDVINEWNRDRRFGNAYLDADLDAAIEFDVNLEHGVSRDNLDAAFSIWAVVLEQYTAHVGYPTSAE